MTPPGQGLHSLNFRASDVSSAMLKQSLIGLRCYATSFLGGIHIVLTPDCAANAA